MVLVAVLLGGRRRRCRLSVLGRRAELRPGAASALVEHPGRGVDVDVPVDRAGVVGGGAGPEQQLRARGTRSTRGAGLAGGTGLARQVLGGVLPDVARQ